MQRSLLAAVLVIGLIGTPAQAGEVFGGLYAHAVDTPFTLDTGEEGADIQIGARTEPIGALDFLGKPSAQAFGSINTAGDTNFVAAGLSWKIDVGPIYVRPGVGLALHDAPNLRVDIVTGMRTDLGSRVLFTPEIAIGASVSSRVSLEMSWVHISNAQVFNSEQNPGIDMIGLRMNARI
ncbi:hypothetical protein A9995_15325 [Erythrobacter sp. QSSC1-22B]|uniref:acyloxyacyl hydrolase n=1 Tax=Erythrobacter sp. QSSC1-22B TaxID=1860125 RepID=UPI000804FF4F|nr:acyloxyacyl hydrolase [Erythrobacter sp. QSSC1-22B]OBX17659.1 hypothetical protein A9995_15325 [Erythrobacter sp. QSSC1-22B]